MLRIEYPAAGKSTNLIMGLSGWWLNECLKYKTECRNILLRISYNEHEKWAYCTVKIIRNYFACNNILNKNDCYVINEVKIYIKIDYMVIYGCFNKEINKLIDAL